MAENEVETAKLEGVDSVRCKQLLVRDNASKECKPLTDRVNMELAAVKNLKNEFMRIMLSKCHVRLLDTIKLHPQFRALLGMKNAFLVQHRNNAFSSSKRISKN